MQINIKKVRDTAMIPTRGSEEAAGYDMYADLKDKEMVIIAPHTSYMMNLGVAMEIPKGFFGALYPRSGLSAKKGLRPANCVGVIDSDYRGEIMVALHNDTDIAQEVHHGDRVAQLIIQHYAAAEFVQTNELSETKRGAGGYGSTGA